MLGLAWEQGETPPPLLSRETSPESGCALQKKQFGVDIECLSLLAKTPKHMGHIKRAVKKIRY